MVTMNGFTVTPHHRQNRRRERPGSRSRRTLTRKSNIQNEFTEGMLDAYDSSIPLPSDKARPSPLLRENFHQNWQRWKAREAAAEEEALLEKKRLQLEFEMEQAEQQRLYGGDISDDELYKLGILYDSKDEEDDFVTCEAPREQASSPPMFIFRAQRKPRRPRRRIMRRSLPLCLSFSSLSSDADIARFLSSSPMPIQHCEPSNTSDTTETDIPQSLPPTIPALASSESSLDTPNDLTTSHSNSQPQSQPDSLLLQPTSADDWEFIAPSHDDQIRTPSSEPETWILLSDDS